MTPLQLSMTKAYLTCIPVALVPIILTLLVGWRDWSDWGFALLSGGISAIVILIAGFVFGVLDETRGPHMISPEHDYQSDR